MNAGHGLRVYYHIVNTNIIAAALLGGSIILGAHTISTSLGRSTDAAAAESAKWRLKAEAYEEMFNKLPDQTRKTVAAGMDEGKRQLVSAPTDMLKITGGNLRDTTKKAADDTKKQYDRSRRDVNTFTDRAFGFKLF
jgi:hypothetical protein